MKDPAARSHHLTQKRNQADAHAAIIRVHLRKAGRDAGHFGSCFFQADPLPQLPDDLPAPLPDFVADDGERPTDSGSGSPAQIIGSLR